MGSKKYIKQYNTYSYDKVTPPVPSVFLRQALVHYDQAVLECAYLLTEWKRRHRDALLEGEGVKWVRI
jgi:hypothetical protein